MDVLGGAPGIFSARWSGTHGDDQANLDLLLAQLGDIDTPHRGAYFSCAAALALPDGTERVVEGRLNGILRHTPSGTNGFGYDPILQPEGETRTCAELTPAEKNAISHRGRRSGRWCRWCGSWWADSSEGGCSLRNEGSSRPAPVGPVGLEPTTHRT